MLPPRDVQRLHLELAAARAPEQAHIEARAAHLGLDDAPRAAARHRRRGGRRTEGASLAAAEVAVPRVGGGGAAGVAARFARVVRLPRVVREAHAL